MTEFFKTYLPNVYLIPDEFIEATKQTLYMSFGRHSLVGSSESS